MDLNFKDLEPKKSNNFISNFIDELSKALDKTVNSNIHNSMNLEEGSIYVVQDFNDEKFSLVDVNTGEESTVYITYDENRIDSNVFQMSKNDFYSLDLGSNLIFQNGKLSVYNGKFSLCNKAASKLEDMYFSIEQDKNSTFLVDKITDKKIFLTYSDGSGYFSIYKEAYPDFQVGDSLKKENGKYVKL